MSIRHRLALVLLAVICLAQTGDAVMFNRQGDLAIGLGRYWYDDTRTIAQECNTLRPGCVVALSDGTVIAEVGTNQIRANGRGVWAFIPTTGGYLDSFGRRFPDRGPDAVGPDGAIVLRPPSNAFADVLEPNGEIWRLADVDIFDVQLLGQKRAIYRERANPQPLRARGLTVEQPDKGYGWARLIAVGDRFALLYQSFDGGALVFDGRIVADGVAFYRPDAIVLNDTLKIAWSTSEGEVGSTPPPLVMSLARLATLPKIADRLRVPVPPVPPVHNPPPPAPTQVPDETATVKAVAAANGDLLTRLRVVAATCRTEADPSCATVSVLKGEMTRRIAWAVYQHERRWGLRKKPGGANAIRPVDGVPLATDVLMWREDGAIVDVMSDTDAGWGGQRPGDVQPVDQWVQPLPEGDAPTPPGPVVPPPAPVPPPVDLAPLLARVAALEARMGVLEASLHEIASKPPVDLPALQAAIDAALLNYEVNGKTERDRLGLQHVVRLGIVRKR